MGASIKLKLINRIQAHQREYDGLEPSPQKWLGRKTVAQLRDMERATRHAVKAQNIARQLSGSKKDHFYSLATTLWLNTAETTRAAIKYARKHYPR